MSFDALDVVGRGLPQTLRPARVAVVGAGMAGLVAAHELRRAGHEVSVFEAQARVGGRVSTLREPFSDGLYAEAGAMRVPRSHALTHAYIERFGLTTQPFTPSNPMAFEHVYGAQRRISEAALERGTWSGLHVHEEGLSADEIWARAMEPVMALAAVEGDSWPAIAAQFDQFSLREFLEVRGLSEAAIERVGLTLQLEALMNLACLEVFREELSDCFRDVVAIDGGMDRLPKAFLSGLRDVIRFGARVTSVAQSAEGVTVHWATGASLATFESEYAIVALPFSVLRHVEFPQGISRGKERAIRQLRYDAATKILLQCRRRFWEEDDGIFGGASVTDMPIRAMYYPDHGRESGRGVLLGSYTWGEDAQRWGSLSPSDRVTQAIENVARIHPQVLLEFEVGASKVWHDDEFAGGAFASFEPGQESRLQAEIVRPEGRLFFAGEHTSLTHAWIQGAIESGLRAAWEVDERSRKGGT